MPQKELILPYSPSEKQTLLHTTAVDLILYGGAAGGGKSHGIRWDLIGWCLQVPGLDTFLFRRTLGELEDNHIRKIQRELPPELGRYNDGKKRFEFYNGSGLNFCYCEREDDVKRYQGAEIHVLGVDEAAHLSGGQLGYLITRIRLGEFSDKIPEQFRHQLPRGVFGSNPGGPGHQFLKENFVDPAPPMTVFHNENLKDPDDPEDLGKTCIFIPARMKDNSHLDKGYGGQFGFLPPELAKALREGDWDAVVGQALHTLSREPDTGHLLRPFTPPRHWTRFCSIDWGTAKPFSVGWYCVSDGATLAAKDGMPERYIPPGAIVRYAEWYGWNGKANQGCRMESPAVARGIILRESERNDPPLDYRIIDSAARNKHDGPSVVERMQDTDERFRLRPSEKDRKAGYAEFLTRLAVDPEAGGPMFFCTANCTHFWRTVPTLTLEENDPEKGPSTSLEDHVYDEVVYALLSRPMTRTQEEFEDEERREQMRALKRSGSRYATK
jgi:hypothetical protein